MNELKDAKRIYDHIVVPEELEDRLRQTIAQAPKYQKPNNLVKFTRWAATAAAALFLCFSVGLNSNQSFAMEMFKLPLIGSIAKVLTIRSYESTNDTTTMTVEIPEIQMEEASENVIFAIADVNAEIDELVEEYTRRKQLEIDAYKETFFENGGTEEEWQARNIDLNVSYEVKHQSETTLSLMISGWISWYNFEEERSFYNIDLVTGKQLTLVDLLGENAYTYAEECVISQMNEKIAEDSEMNIYWGINDSDDMAAEFIGVDESTPFYLNSDGKVVISYNKYDVAPGYMGIQEFIIP